MERKRYRKRRRKLEDWGKPARQLENWGKKRIFNRKTKKLFRGVGIAAVAAIAVIAIAGGVLILARFVNQAIETRISENLSVNLEQINQAAQPPQQTPQPAFTVPVAQPSMPAPAPQIASPLPTYTSIVFFSGVGWLNATSTTAYRDNNEAAMMFPPKFLWSPRAPEALGGPEAPAGITTKVIQDGGKYKVLIYAQDGSEILSESSTPIVSNYPGTVDIGGTADDFIVVYGSYWGSGARITNVDGSWQVQDLSPFFGIRQMNGGFQPAVIKVVNGNNVVTYYVYSLTSGNPKLIKLFTNGTSQIQGAVDFSPLLFAHGEKSADFAVGETDNLIAKVADASSTVSYYQFTDEGFDKSQPLEVDSVNLNGFPVKISQAVISETGLSSGGGDVSFFLSDDGANWLSSIPGSTVNFPNPTNRIFWRVLFNSSGPSAQAGDQYSSPFLTKVRVEYSGTLF